MDQPPKPPDETAARVDGRREEDQAARLPGDLLADVLRRIPPRWLAAARCVCRAWRDAVDDRRLLRADLLPLSLAGLFVHFDEHKYPEFLARPSSVAGAPAVSGDLSFLPSASPHCGYGWQEDCVDWGNYDIENHCNGLLLLRNNCVVNPATRWWNTLPRCPAKRDEGSVEYCARLAYDPMISPYYKVFMIPKLGGGNHRGTKVDPSTEESGWPPYAYKMYVFSSKSGCWEEKDFVREGDAEGAVGEAREAGYSEFSAVYFREALYVHCQNDFLMRVSLPNNTYTVIKPPRGLKMEDYPDTTIARSEKGLYFVELDASWIKNKCWLRVWFHEESCGQMEWILKHDKDFKHMLPHQWFCTQVKWILEDINYNLFRASSFPEDNKKEKNEEKFEWDSEEDVQDKDMVDHGYFEEKKELFADIKILGFHPYKEIVFLSLLERTCLAYHLNGSKIEELGNIYPKEYSYFKELTNEQEKITSFPYTPCWMEAFPGKN